MQKAEEDELKLLGKSPSQLVHREGKFLFLLSTGLRHLMFKKFSELMNKNQECIFICNSL